MPSASNKQENKPTEICDTMNYVNKTVEKKIRNLEKRKAKLDNYRKDADSGKTLNEDQKRAVARYDEVESQLELARDLMKQFSSIASDVITQQRKQIKKEQIERAQLERSRLKQVLLIQDVLNNMGGDTRSDFLEGANGAVKLSEETLSHLDDLYKLLAPTREEAGEKFEEQLSSASEHYTALIDGKDKKILGTTYKELKHTLDTIHQSGYFGGCPPPEEKAEDLEEDDVQQEELQDEFQDARETLESRSSNGHTEGEEGTGGDVTPQEEPTDTIDIIHTMTDDIHIDVGRTEPPQKDPEENICFLQDSQIQAPHPDAPIISTPPGLPVAVDQSAEAAAISTQTFTNQSFPPASDVSLETFQPSPPLEEQPKQPEIPVITDHTRNIGNWGDTETEVQSATFTNSQSGFRRGGRGGRGMINGYGGKPPRSSYQNGGRSYNNNYGNRDGGGYRRDGGHRGSSRGGRGGGLRGSGRPRGGRGGGGGYQAKQ